MKVGILTYHYSNNFGGVLQAYALYKVLESLKTDVEIIDYVPRSYTIAPCPNILRTMGLRKNPLKMDLRDINPTTFVKRVIVKLKYNRKIEHKFNVFRNAMLRSTTEVSEDTISDILSNFDLIIVGSDQIWGPVERNRPIYFLAYEIFTGKRVSYAADSTTAMVDQDHSPVLKGSLGKFDSISVRNNHSQMFVNEVLGTSPEIVADPTLLWDFSELACPDAENPKPYIFVYILGDDIKGGNAQAIKQIKETYGNLPVYAATIPTMKFNICDYADKVFYDLGPVEWLEMIKNASFVYTDSFHGALFSLKFRKPFLAYYAEAMRATRFIDLGKRYQIEKYIVNSVDEIGGKGSLLEPPDFTLIDSLIEQHKKQSIRYLKEALGIGK